MRHHENFKHLLALSIVVLLIACSMSSADDAEKDFNPLFNGKDISGWQGATDAYFVKDGAVIFKKGATGNLFTDKEYENFVLRLEFRTEPGGNNGVGLRAKLQGTPAYTGMEIQVLDDEHPKYKDLLPEQYTGAVYGAAAPKRGHVKPAWQWNIMEIVADGTRIKVTLNGAVINDVDLSKVGPKEIHGQKLEGLLRPKGYIALNGHNDHVEFRNIRIKELPAGTEPKCEEGFTSLFDGKTLNGWQGNLKGYAVENGALVCKKNGGGRLNSDKQYADFVLRFEFKLYHNGNNGIALRAPAEGDAAYCGMECQVLDNSADVYKDLKPYQYHGSIYGIFPAKRGTLKPVGQWNSEEIICDGNKIKVTLNDTVIVDADLATVENATVDGKDHPGRFRKDGHIGFLGHGTRVEFRNLRIKELNQSK